MNKTFFNKARAERFANDNGGKVYMDKDAFGQTIYIVKWHYDGEDDVEAQDEE